MNGWIRRFAVGTSASLLAAAFLVGPAGRASSTTPLLPNLSLARVLDIANVEAPPAGVGLEIHVDFPAEHPLVVDGVGFTAFTADILPTGGMQVLNAVPARTSADAGPEIGECDDPFFTPTGKAWDANAMPIEWRYNRSSTPINVGQWRAQYEIRSAHAIWTKVRSDCRGADRVDFSYSFAGNSGKRIKYDQHNVVVFTNLDAGALAANYTWYVGGTTRESDLGINKDDYRWTAKAGGRNRYQIVNVATHELGHQIGLDDVTDPHGALTMFGRIGKGEVNKLSLGLGDVRGAEALSP